MSNNNLEGISDEAVLSKMLNDTDDFDERKRIRGRLKDVREIKMKEMEAQRQARTQRQQDSVALRAKQAEEDKQRKLAAFSDQAKTPTSARLNHHAGTSDDAKARYEASQREKEKKLRAFDEQAKDHSIQETQNRSTQLMIQSRQEHAAKSKQAVLQTQTTKTTTVNKASGDARATFKQMDDAAAPAGGNALAPRAGVQRSASAIKDLLLRWAQAQVHDYKNVEITNFSSSWNDGMAFCALIHHFYPESFDFSRLDPKKRRGNFRLAFDVAEKYGKIAPLLDVDDMVRMKKPDWKCVFTYVQAMYQKLKDHERCLVPGSQPH